MPTPSATYDTVIDVSPSDTPSRTQERIAAGDFDVIQKTISIPGSERCTLVYNIENDTVVNDGHIFALYIYSDPRRNTLAVPAILCSKTVGPGAEVYPEPQPEFITKISAELDVGDLVKGNTYYCTMKQINPPAGGPARTIVWNSFMIHVDNHG